jgi:DNA repair protein RecO (recombination protein O)
MALGKSAAIVIGRLPLGESDRLVTFFSREFGKIRGVAKSARRMKSRFGGALELFTLGQLVFFDTGRSDLVRVDHFDIERPFQRVRDDLARLGHAAWMVECVARLSADRDANTAVYGALVRALKSLEGGASPGMVAVAFGLRCIDALGHRLRLDACVGCGRAAGRRRVVEVDADAGGVLCPSCGRERAGALRLSAAALGAVERLRGMAWAEATGAHLGPVEAEVRRLLETHVAGLIGQPTRTSRFLREVQGAGAVPGSP